MGLKIKTKLRYGIGLLFAMIVLLGGLSVKNISDMSADTRNIYIAIRVLENGEAEEYVGDVILLKNITEFKELDSAKTTFISTISHELKTPISAIMMSLRLLEDARVGAINDEQKALAESIKESSNRLLEITSELLKMTQVETGKLQLNPKITKPIELIEYAIKANQVQADRFNSI